MTPFRPTGPLLSFTGANSVPTSVQAISKNNTVDQQVCLTNTDVANDCVVGWASTDAQAKLNAAVANLSDACYYLLARSQVIVGIPSGYYVTGITPGSGVTAVIKVQAGEGE